jgi:predicted short-subunit dehydrogenase-like oxidoreductase (DUF2520 family)
VIELPHKQREAFTLPQRSRAISRSSSCARAGRLLKDQKPRSALLLPLWKAAAERASEVDPDEALTGPARRGDRKTIGRHLTRLKHDGDLRRAYALLSRMILKAYGHGTDGLDEL